LSAPYLILGVILSLILFILNETIAPNGPELADRILHRHQQLPQDYSSREWQRNLVFRNDREGRDWHLSAYNLETFEMVSPKLAWRRDDGSRLEIFGQRGAWTNGAWTFYGVQSFFHPTESTSRAVIVHTNEISLPELTETPEQIKSEIKISSLSTLAASKKAQLSIAEILNYRRLHPNLDRRTEALLDTQLQGRLAAPWTCLVVAIIAIPFGCQGGRRNVFVGVASSIFLCFSYFVVLRLGIALGTGGYVPAWFAAWFPNLFFAVAGLWLIRRVR
jgi:lipopolysaccharide export system permease protein